MASVKVEFELQGGDKVVTTNEKIIKQLKEQGVQYNVLEGAIEGVTQASKENTETQVQGTEEVTQSYKEFISEIKSAEKELKFLEATGQQNTKRYQELTQRVAQFKDAQEEVGRRLNANKSGADAFIGSVAGIAGGFAAAQGAIGLFGEESENVQKALLKVQSALSLAQGIEQIKDAKASFQNLATLISGNVVKAFSTLKGAIAATGIGLLIIGVGLLIANFDKLFPSAKNAEKAVNDLNTALDRLKNTQDDLRRRRLDDQKVLEAQYKTQEKSEEDLINLRIKRANEEAKQARIDRDNVNRAYENQITKANGNAKLISEIREKQAADTQKYIELENSYATQSLIFQEELAQEQERKRKERRDKALAAARVDAQRRVDILEDGIEKELEALRVRYEEEKRIARENGENIQLVTDLYNKNRLEIFNKFIKDYTEKNKEVTDAIRDANETAFETELRQNREQYSKLFDLRVTALIDEAKVRGDYDVEKIKQQINNDERINKLIEDGKKKERKIRDKYIKEYLDADIEFNKSLNKETFKSFEERKEFNDGENEQFIDALVVRYQSAILAASKYRDISEEERKNVLLGDEVAEQEKINQEAIERATKATTEYRKKLEKLLEIRFKISEGDRQINRNQLDTQIETQQKILNLNRGEVKNRQQVNREIQTLNNELRKTEIQAEIARIDLQLKLYKEDETQFKILTLQKLKLQNELSNAIKEGNEQNLTGVQKLNEFLKEYQSVINAITQALSDLNEAFNSFYDLRLAKLEAFYEKEFELLDERKQREIENYALTQEEIQNINDRYALEETALEEKKAKELKEIEKKRANDQLVFTIAQIIANQSLAIVKTIAQYGGTPIGFATAGLIGVSTAAQVAAAVNQRNIIVKYEKGGILNGFTHEQGGIYAGGVEMEGGEAVINRRSTAMFAPLLSSINQAGGGRPFTSPNLTGNLNLSPNPNTQSISQILNKMSTQRAYILSDDVQSDTARQSRIRRSSTF